MQKKNPMNSNSSNNINIYVSKYSLGLTEDFMFKEHYRRLEQYKSVLVSRAVERYGLKVRTLLRV